jgi:hypothetical protein
MDTIIKLIEPIIGSAIQTAILPIIKANLTKLDVVEAQIDEQLDEIVKLIKTTIDTIPTFPVGFTEETKQQIIDNLPFDKIDELLDKIDLTMIEQIPISTDIDPEGLIKTRLAQFPNTIRKKLKSKIREAFSVKTSSGVISTNLAANLDTVPAATTVPAANLDTVPADVVSIKEAMNTMKPEKKEETINDIIEYLKSTGMFDEIKELMLKKEGVAPVAPAVVAPATQVAPPLVAPVAPPAPPVVGGAKQKRRRKTKKNIYQRSRGRTQYGRKF